MKFLKVKVRSSSIDNNNQNNDANGRIELIALSKPLLWLIIVLISLNNAFLSITPIILQNFKNQIKFELRLTTQTYDLFRSFNNFGALLGAIIFYLVIEKINHKNIIISFLLINCLSHFTFYLKLPFIALLISRFISGLVSSFCIIYFPFWVDKFGINNWIGFMQGLVQVSKIFGISIGYSLNYILSLRKWNFGFLLESVLALFFPLIIVSFFSIFPVCLFILAHVLIWSSFFDVVNS